MKKTFTLLTCLLLLFNQISFSQAGSLDTSFGPNKTGRLIEEPFSDRYSAAYAMAVQPDGKIIVAGFADVPKKKGYVREILLFKYNSNGLKDKSFGDHGMVLTSVFDKDNIARHVVLQKDNKILVLAGFYGPGVLIRYQTNGTIDSSFGKNGMLNTGPSAALAIQPNGKIIVGGGITLIRYKNNGRLDSSFGTNGTVLTSTQIASILVQPDDKIVVAGGHFEVSRYAENGKPDKTFGNNGLASISYTATSQDNCNDAVLQPYGKIILVGSTTEGEGKFEDYAIVRFLPDGKIDNNFGTDGKISTEFKYHWREIAHAVALQANGKIVVTGLCHTGSHIAGISRYFGGDGRLDTAFGGTGKVFGDFRDEDYYDSEGNAIAVEPDGKILIAGIENLSEYSTLKLGLARYNNTSNIVHTLPAIANNNFKKSSIAISPNPVKDILYLQGLSSNTKHVVAIFNVNGKQVLTATVQGDNYSFNIIRLLPGLYYVKVDGAESINILKFIKQ